ncbi:hypothetical protein FIBSPDRAFT_887938 [Athelia psychrophila]|uniref:Uncharacterized protein n=1 Tax=Athelia psychrophila TaxID=1759441 RepID=A0A166P433_9AGAM|nr:hypothetical protein FIBSPDRAFT_887938 [Fibularhizoctonia sp. CBS 109695]
MVVLREIMERVAFSTTTDSDSPTANPALAQCYTIPYGAFGFISHVLTLYTMYCSSSRRKWWAPWRAPTRPPPPGWLRKRMSWLILLYRIMASCAKVAITFALSIYTIYKCHDAYRLLAVWKMMLSCFDGASEGMFLYHRAEKRGTGNVVFFAFQWCLLFLPGVIAGIVGIKELAEQYWPSSATLHTVTWIFVGVFSGAVAIIILVVTIITLKPSKETKDVNQNRISVATTTDSDMKQTGRGSMIKDDPATAKELDPDQTQPQEAESPDALPDAGNPGRGAAVAGLTEEWKVLEGGLDGDGVFKHFFKIFFRVLGVSVIVAYVLGTAYADWMIGIAAGNIVGVPHDRVLGGVYFAAKHLSMLIF